MAPVLLVLAKRLAVPLGGLLWRALGGVVLERVLLYGLFWTSQRWASYTPWTLDDEMIWQAIITYYGGADAVPESLSDYRARRNAALRAAVVEHELPAAHALGPEDSSGAGNHAANADGQVR